MMKNIIVFLLILATLPACSTFKNGIGGGESEDYNKLTYGDHNQGWGARTPVETPMHRGEQISAKEESRDLASVKEDDVELDPSDEQDSEKIETHRGVASAAKYSHGGRATRDDFIDHSAGDGSLWAGENDSNYFYSKNKVRAMGDVVTVKVEDELVRHIGEEIKKTLTPAEQEVEMALYIKNNGAAKDDKDLEAYRKIASDDPKSSDAEEVKSKMEKAVRWSQVDLSNAIALKSNEEMRAEIIDRFPNGNYKIRTVKKVLYRGSSKLVSMVGIAPAADFDESDTIKSGKLYEYKVRIAH